MLKHLPSEQMGHSDHGWLKSCFHFSFADYYNPANMNFGTLRVINDDIIAPNTGFDMHPHQNMEIISYVINGELTHQDSMGNKNTISRGMVQYMSAGTGVMHSEYNLSANPGRFLQIWILPKKNGLHPAYGDYTFEWDLRCNNWLHMVSPYEGNAPVQIHQDANIYSLSLDSSRDIYFKMDKNRQGYFVQIEGSSTVTGTDGLDSFLLKERDALEVIEESITIHSQTDSHILFIEMAKTN